MRVSEAPGPSSEDECTTQRGCPPWPLCAFYFYCYKSLTTIPLPPTIPLSTDSNTTIDRAPPVSAIGPGGLLVTTATTSRAQNIQTRRQVGHPDWPGHSDTRCAVSVVAYHRGNIWLALLYSLALAMPQPVKSRGPTHVPVWGELLWVKPCVSAGTRLPQYAGGFTPTLRGSPPPVSPNTICGHRAISYICCCALLFVFFPAPLFIICFVFFF